MRLLKPSYSIEAGTFGQEALDAIERAARTCYKSEPAGDPGAFVRMLIKRGHESTLEHVGFTVRFVVDRGVSHELVRHRLASFSQESTRYVDYTGQKSGGHCQFIIPSWLPTGLGEGFWEAWDGHYRRCYGISDPLVQDLLVTPEDPLRYWLDAMLQAEMSYQILRNREWSPQYARSVLPNSTKTEIVVTANYREWRHIFNLRTAKASHPQMREVMLPLLAEMKEKTPVLFDDLGGN